MATLETQRTLEEVLTSTRATGREHKLVRYLVGSDASILIIAAVASLGILRPSTSLGFSVFWAAGTILIALLAFSFYGLYDRDRKQIAVSSLDEIRDFLHALTLIAFFQLSLGQALEFWGIANYSPVSVVLLFWALSLLFLPLSRGSFRHYAVPHLNTPQNTAIVGAGFVGQAIARKVRKHPEYNLRIVGFLDDDPHELGTDLDDLPILGSEDELIETIRRYRVSRVILAFSNRQSERLLEIIRSAGLRDVHISIVPRYFELMAANITVADVEGIPVLDVPAPSISRLSRFTKRAFDLAITIPAMIVLAPLFLAIAAAIKIGSRGPVFFRQPRMGRDDRVFYIYKFRTMVDGAETMRSDLLEVNESTGPLFKIREDPRVTHVGAWLRRTSLDELPQLINVLKGEMSLVGPRPFVVYEDERIAGWARRRLDLTPGITGLWQVSGRNDIGFDEMVKLDYLYVNNWSLWWDIKILLRTIPIVLGRRGY